MPGAGEVHFGPETIPTYAKNRGYEGANVKWEYTEADCVSLEKSGSSGNAPFGI